jgi:hypothetical protein
MHTISTSTAAYTALKYQNQISTANSSKAITSNRVRSISKNDTTSTIKHSSKMTIDDLEQKVGPAFKLDISAEGAFLQSQAAKEQLDQQSLSDSNTSSQSAVNLFEV